MHLWVAGGKIAAGRRRVDGLCAEPDLGADAIAIGVDADQLQRQPVICAAAVQQDQRMAAEHGDDDVDVAVIVDIPKGGSAAGYSGQIRVVHFFELACLIAKQRRRLEIAQTRVNFFDIIEDMALRDEEILPAAVLEVRESDSPTGAVRGGGGEAGGKARITELAAAFVVIER